MTAGNEEPVESMDTVSNSTNEENSSAANTAFNENIQITIMEACKKARKKGIGTGILISSLVVLFCLVVVAGISIGKRLVKGTMLTGLAGKLSEEVVTQEVKEKINTLNSAVDYMYLNSDEVTNEQLRDGMYKGFMDALGDPYSVYYTQDEYQDLVEGYEGSYEGIGAYLLQNMETMEIMVSRPMPDSPCENAGMKTGDIFVSVDGEDVVGQDLTLVVSKVKGPKGTSVNIGVQREGEEDVLYFDIERDVIETITVDYEMLDDHVGHLWIYEFDDVTVDQFDNAYTSLLNEGMEYLILDLRDNPGGNVDSVVEIADRFLPKGLVVYTEDKNGTREDYDAIDDDKIDIPMVVLVNGNSASASEILTGSLKDYGVGTVIGTTTFGKGIVQNIIPLGDGSGIKITVSKYFTPKGINIHGIGIEPDITYELDYERYLEEGYDNQIQAASKYLLTGEMPKDEE